MRAVVQRVVKAQVTVDQVIVGAIEIGYLVYLGIEKEDTDIDLEWMLNKITGLRVFGDGDGKMNQSLLERRGGALVISQFTLFGTLSKGFRPSFNRAALPEMAEAMYLKFIEGLKRKEVSLVQEGKFRAMMQVEAINDGPVTIWLDSKNKDY